MTKIKAAFLSLIFLSLGSCGSGGRIYDRDANQNIRTVAIVGFEVVQPQKAFDPLRPSSKLPGDDTMLGNMKISIAKPNKEKLPYYTSLHEFLRSQVRWSVLPLDTVIKNAGYIQAFKATMEGGQSKTMYMNHTEENFAIPGLIDIDGITILKQAGRDRLMQALNVDAIVVQRMHVVLDGTSVMGVGSFKPKTKIWFQVYKRGVEKPVWQNLQAEGEAVAESIGKTRFTVDLSKLDKLALESAQSAYQTLLSKR